MCDGCSEWYNEVCRRLWKMGVHKIDFRNPEGRCRCLSAPATVSGQWNQYCGLERARSELKYCPNKDVHIGESGRFLDSPGDDHLLKNCARNCKNTRQGQW